MPILKKTNPMSEIKRRIRIAGVPNERMLSVDALFKRKQMLGWYSCDSNKRPNLRPRIRFFLIWVVFSLTGVTILSY